MPRPRTNTANRTRRLIVRLTDEECVAIRDSADRAGLRLSEYVRRVAIAGHIVNVQQSGASVALALQLRRVGNNLNQLTRHANTHHEIPPELAGVCRQLETVLDRVIGTM